MQLLIDTERLWHVVGHPGPRPRYALITSWESDEVIANWIKRQAASEHQLLGARQ
jgi:heme-degrading monooxygenase HmoA